MPKTAIAVLFCALPLCALDTHGFHNNQDRTMRCNDRNHDSDRVRVCDVREETISATGAVQVNASPNGGVSVKGWDRHDILVRAKVEAWGESDADAKSMESQVRLSTSGGDIHSNGPESSDHDGHDRRGWSVSYEVFVPHLTDLTAKSNNGGVSIEDVGGTIRMETTNGGIVLARVSGDVRGETTNGGVSVALMGDHWDGAGMEVSSTNGGVNVSVPSGYSAHLEGSTVNGGVHSEFGGTASAESERHRAQSVNATVGNGGATVKVTTVNGGVVFSRS